MSDRICIAEDCGEYARTRGYCSPHYGVFKRLGYFAPISLVERFEQKIQPGPDGCWNWVGALKKDGYGQKWDGTRVVAAHRWSYEYHRAQIPAGLYIDHLCRNKRCVNPWHLEPVTNSVNVRRGRAGEVNSARQLAKNFCPYGHEFTDENTYRSPARGDRQCRTCLRARQAVAASMRDGLRPTPTW